MKIYNIVSFGAKLNSDELSTKALQKAIDYCNENGGGTVVIPKGIIVVSTVYLRSNVTIKIEGTILGASSFYDYDSQEKIDYPLYQDASHSYFNCSMFVGLNCENIGFCGKGSIDMRSVWDEDNVRNIVHRGPKCIALKYCNNVNVSGIKIFNATDLAIYFAGCENVNIYNVKMKVHIDGISPDNSKNVNIRNCDIVSGDDGIVFKSSYTLNKTDYCDNIKVRNCKIQSRCNAIKFGTESNGGFTNFDISNIKIKNTTITGISIESVDGAEINNILINKVKMKNVGTPLFIHLGKRMRGPKGLEIGSIQNVFISNITATGPYKDYDIIARNYDMFKANNNHVYPWIYGLKLEETEENVKNGKRLGWQITSNVCGLENKYIKDISLTNIKFKLWGGVTEYDSEVPESCGEYPEVYVYGRTLPASGIYFRHVSGLKLKNVKCKFYNKDNRKTYIFDDVITND